MNIFKARVAHPNYLFSAAGDAWYSLVIRGQQLKYWAPEKAKDRGHIEATFVSHHLQA